MWTGSVDLAMANITPANITKSGLATFYQAEMEPVTNLKGAVSVSKSTANKSKWVGKPMQVPIKYKGKRGNLAGAVTATIRGNQYMSVQSNYGTAPMSTIIQSAMGSGTDPDFIKRIQTLADLDMKTKLYEEYEKRQGQDGLYSKYNSDPWAGTRLAKITGISGT